MRQGFCNIGAKMGYVVGWQCATYTWTGLLIDAEVYMGQYIHLTIAQMSKICVWISLKETRTNGVSDPNLHIKARSESNSIRVSSADSFFDIDSRSSSISTTAAASFGTLWSRSGCESRASDRKGETIGEKIWYEQYEQIVSNFHSKEHCTSRMLENMRNSLLDDRQTKRGKKIKGQCDSDDVDRFNRTEVKLNKIIRDFKIGGLLSFVFTDVGPLETSRVVLISGFWTLLCAVWGFLKLVQ